MDLVVAMAPFVDELTMTKTFELIRPFLEVKTPIMTQEVSNPDLLRAFLINLLVVGAFVFRSKSPACRRRRTACWRRCAEQRKTSANHLSHLIWKHSNMSFLIAWKVHLHQQRGWGLWMEGSVANKCDYYSLHFSLMVSCKLCFSQDWSVSSILWKD